MGDLDFAHTIERSQDCAEDGDALVFYPTAHARSANGAIHRPSIHRDDDEVALDSLSSTNAW
ncbi:hypothetical protein [Nannocystis pusilla]|uniref:hypothetical protein n=1 Tax=Nannocystis pusilla TaxID=889268 RepID=UPI003DA46278